MLDGVFVLVFVIKESVVMGVCDFVRVWVCSNGFLGELDYRWGG